MENKKDGIAPTILTFQLLSFVLRRIDLIPSQTNLEMAVQREQKGQISAHIKGRQYDFMLLISVIYASSLLLLFLNFC